MADFAKWIVAAEPALPWRAGEFLRAYQENGARAHEEALDASPLVSPLRSLPPWSGTASELLALLTSRVEESTRRFRAWPKTPRALSGALRRIAPSLKANGLEVTFLREPGGKRRVINLQEAMEVAESASPASPPSRPLVCDAGEAGDGRKGTFIYPPTDELGPEEEDL